MAVKVITAATEYPVSLAEAKLNLRIVQDDEDADVERMVRAATQAAEGRMNRALMPQVLEFAADAFPPACGLKIPRPPMRGDVTVKYIDSDGAEQTLDPAAYLVNAYVEPPQITAAYSTPWPTTRAQAASVVVRYDAGYADAASVPEPIRQWILLAVGAMYENRAANADVQLYSLPDDFFQMLIQPYMVYE